MKNYGIAEKRAHQKLVALLKSEGYVLNENYIAEIPKISSMFVKNGLTDRVYKERIEDETGKVVLIAIPFKYQRYRKCQIDRRRGDEMHAEFNYLPYARKKKFWR